MDTIPKKAGFRWDRTNLQWSHGFSAMDTRFRRDKFLVIVYLQWSHGFSAMDTIKLNACSGEMLSLQWSHGFSAMDTAGNQGHRYNIIPVASSIPGFDVPSVL